MQYFSAILLTMGALAAAFPVNDADQTIASPAKRDSPTDTCGLSSLPQLTEARVANMLESMDGTNDILSFDYGSQNNQIACTGGTGIFLNVNPDSTHNDQFTIGKSKIHDMVNDQYKTCYSHTPQSWEGDSFFMPAIRVFHDGYNIVVHGSNPC